MAFGIVTSAAMPVRDQQLALAARGRIGTWLAEDGWSHRRFDMPVAEGTAPRGSILFQGGRGDVFEKYFETMAHWADRGWAVTSFDWRGQGGSGRLSANARVGHAADFAPWIADLARFWAQWRAETPGPHVLMGHSMGGHLILRAMLEGVVVPDAAVLVAPMLGLHAKPFGAGLARRVAHLMARLGAPERAAWRDNEIPGTRFARNVLLTGDADRYADELAWKELRPEIGVGPPSWGWVAAAFDSCRYIETRSALATLKVPMLILSAEADRLVDATATARIAARLPNARLVRFGAESAHEILREVDAVRDHALSEIDALLDSTAPAA